MDKDPSDRDLPGQRHHWTDTPQTETLQTEIPQDTDPLGTDRQTDVRLT